jgi:YidC/Oxa1 family membrane protein insertase
MGDLFNGLQHLLGSALAFFYEVIPSFGVAIILLTIAINLVLFPLTLRQTRATRSFQDIQPQIKRIQSEYEDDKEKMQQELARVQKEAGATPGGCLLPMLIQLPVWFALFRVFRNVALIAAGTSGVAPVIPADSSLLDAIQGGQTQFLGMSLGTTMSDGIGAGLFGAVPYALLLLSMVGAQYLQQWNAQRGGPASGNRKASRGSQQVVTRIMPLFIGFISWRFPAGLVLYWATSNVVRLGQQSLIFRLDGQTTATTSAPAVDSESPVSPDEKLPQKKPPSRSKKRKGRRRGSR